VNLSESGGIESGGFVASGVAGTWCHLSYLFRFLSAPLALSICSLCAFAEPLSMTYVTKWQISRKFLDDSRCLPYLDAESVRIRRGTLGLRLQI
jgi:hypothetical protein